MPFHTETRERVTIALPVSVAPAAGRDFESTLNTVIHEGAKELLIDCSELELVYSGHVRLLWLAHQKCEERGIALRLTSVRPDIVRVLRLLDLEEFFPYRVSDWADGYADAIQSTGESIRDALARFENYLGQANVPALVATDIKTLFYELASNIVNHGGMDSREVVVVTAVMTVEQDRSQICLKFIDSGKQFDPVATQRPVVPNEAAANQKTRGYGLAMISKLADTFTYERLRGVFNVCAVTKKWS